MPEFRLNTAQIFLTYPRCSLPKADVTTYLKDLDYGNIKLQRLLVAQEQHKDGGQHIHAYLRFGGKIRIRGERFFDVQNHHPNIQGCRSANAVLSYCKKDESYISEQFDGTGWVPWDQVIKRTFSDALQESSSYEEFMAICAIASPRDYVISYDRIDSFARRRFEKVEGYKPRFEEFRYERTLTDWYSTNIAARPDRPMSLLLISPSRFGKTEWARSLGDHFYMCGLFNLVDFKPTAKYGVFDDFNPESLKFSYKQWFGCQKQFTVTDKYCKKCTIHWGKPSIFLMNPPVYDELKSLLDFSWIQCNTVIVILTNKLY